MESQVTRGSSIPMPTTEGTRGKVRGLVLSYTMALIMDSPRNTWAVSFSDSLVIFRSQKLFNDSKQNGLKC